MQIRLSALLEWFPALRGILITDDAKEFDNLLEKYIEQCVDGMEAEAHHLHPDKEEKLSAFLAAKMSHPGLDVRREGFTNGHVDLTIRQEGVIGGQVRLAKAKIYAGPAYHVSALEQLVNRYSTGRPRTGYVIEYVKKAEIEKLVEGLRAHADKNQPVQQLGKTSDHPMKWAYQSNHLHASSALMRVVHVNVNLHRSKPIVTPPSTPPVLGMNGDRVLSTTCSTHRPFASRSHWPPTAGVMQTLRLGWRLRQLSGPTTVLTCMRATASRKAG